MQNFIRCEIFFSYISKVLDIKVICQKFILKYLEPVSKLSIKEIENNNSAREVKRSHIIFRFSLPTYENGSESIVPTVGSFNDPSSRLSFVFTDQWFLASSSNVRPDISSSN
ncbi:hypothetical protein LEP1GSC179_3431 [Leptospira santarosai str. MOR084]|uniref:Uncharacterized protein n=1 Tax=Leptospira santarosai str. MOR084 TaxID=1049984 RepID=A0A0E2BGU2_9LEPT|nr:hypothetical protein LEP1GSC179_3431 [Leptospira santarosai str. MOR084]